MLTCILTFIIGCLVAYIIRLKKRLKKMTENRDFFVDLYFREIGRRHHLMIRLSRYDRKRDARGRFTK